MTRPDHIAADVAYADKLSLHRQLLITRDMPLPAWMAAIVVLGVAGVLAGGGVMVWLVLR